MADETNDDREEWLRKTRERLEREEAEKKRPKAAANGLDGKPELPREEALRQLRLDIGQLNDASTEDDIAVIIVRIASRNDLDPLTHERLLQTIKEQIKTTSIVLLRKQLTASRKQQIHDNHGLDDIDLVREYPGGPPLALESNAIALIRAHPQMRGVFALDEFRQQTGIPVFPVNSDKSPACARGFHAATSETNQVRRLFLQAPRAHRIAMPTGELTHIAVIDVDPAGQQWMYAQDAKGRWPATRIHSMPRGGRHLFFLHSPGLRSSTSKLAPGVDIRAQGGCITIRGPGYEVVGGAPVASFPRSILRDLARLERATEKRREKLLRSLSGGAGSEERLLGWVRASRRGERNQRLFWASCKAAAAGSDCRAFVAAGMAIGLPAIGAGSEERLLGCRRPYQHLEQSTAGYDQTGWLMQVGGCCTALLKSIIAVSIYFAPAPPLRPWVEDDRLWFEAHPQRTHRLRPAHPNEGAEPPDCWIVVRRLEAGARQRLAVAMTDQFNELFSGLDATEEIWEATARAIFDTLVHARESGKDKVSPQELGVYVNFLAAETRA